MNAKKSGWHPQMKGTQRNHGLTGAKGKNIHGVKMNIRAWFMEGGGRISLLYLREYFTQATIIWKMIFVVLGGLF